MPIFDQGYQHWNGTLAGNANRWWAITRHGVRTALKGRAMRIALLMAWGPAVTLAALLCLWGLLERQTEVVKPVLPMLNMILQGQVQEPKAYRVEMWTLLYHFFLAVELRFSMILVLLIGPNLISQDLRFNALPLYFSRPIRRIDYFLGKLGVIVAILAMVMVGPAVVAYVLGLAFSLDWTIVGDTWRILFGSVVYGLIISVSAGMLMLAMSSLSRNSRYVAIAWLILWFVGGIASAVLQEADREQRRRQPYVAMERQVAQQGGDYRQQSRNRRQFREQSPEWQNFRANELEAAKRDWRPLLSYTENLSRLGYELIGADASWKKLAEMRPSSQQSQFMLEHAGARYPWYWSAGVLVGLFGISVCVLNLRVRSLDRLK